MAGTGNVKEHFIVDKSADTDTANDNTLNDDPHLIYPLAADEDIHFELYAFYAAGAGGVQAGMSGPAGFNHLHYSVNLDIAGATKVTSNVAITWDIVALQAAASTGIVRVVGHIHNGVNAGDLVLRWCQNTSNAAVTTMSRGSTLLVWRY